MSLGTLGMFVVSSWSSPSMAGELPTSVIATPSVADSSSDVAADRTIDILTLNTWGLPYPIASVDRRSRFPRIVRYLQDSGVDVAGLEEVWHGAMSLLNLDDVRWPSQDGDSGLALVTEHPVDALAVHIYTASRGFDRFKSKGVLEATVDIPDIGPIDVFVTHLQAGMGDRNAAIRSSQADELVRIVDAVDGPKIVLGDFNLYATNPIDQQTWSMLQEHGLLDAATAVGSVDPTYLGQAQRFDRVYVRSGDGVELSPRAAQVVGYDDDPTTINPPLLSDHQPVRVKIEAARTAVAAAAR